MNKGGRPSKYSQEMEDKAEEYLQTYTDLIPSAAGMAIYLNVNKSTLYRWAEDKDTKFCDILGKLNTLQERKLLEGGLSGNFNAAISKLVLSKHDYSDKQETTHKGGVSVITATPLDEQL